MNPLSIILSTIYIYKFWINFILENEKIQIESYRYATWIFNIWFIIQKESSKKKSTDLYRLCFVLFFVFEVHDYNLIDQSILIDTKQKTKQIGKKINQNRLIIWTNKKMEFFIRWIFEFIFACFNHFHKSINGSQVSVNEKRKTRRKTFLFCLNIFILLHFFSQIQ